MSALNLLQRLSSYHGISLDANGRPFLLGLINQAAKELYDRGVLYLTEREIIVQLDADQQQVTLPYDVDLIIAARRYDSRIALKQEDMRPRYRSDSWGALASRTQYDKWRLKQRSAVSTALLNASVVHVAISEAVDVDILVKVVGSTGAASRVVETITILAGATTASGSKIFTEISDITKDLSDADVTVTNDDGDTLSVIPNNEVRVTYPIYQVLERYESHSETDRMFEVLYKRKFIPLVKDQDEFLDGYYDNALELKTTGYLFMRQDDKLGESSGLSSAADSLVEEVNRQFMPQSEARIVWRPPVGQRVMRRLVHDYSGQLTNNQA